MSVCTWMSVSLFVRHATGKDGIAANVPEAKDRVDERMYLDVSLPVAVCHGTGIDSVAATVPKAKDRVYERMYSTWMSVSLLPYATRQV
jgi:hypothetical protein